MTVQELIEKLKGFNPDVRLGIKDNWGTVQELKEDHLYLIERKEIVETYTVIDIKGKLDD